jgi:small conductance mechanosensitive channel
MRSFKPFYSLKELKKFIQRLDSINFDTNNKIFIFSRVLIAIIIIVLSIPFSRYISNKIKIDLHDEKKIKKRNFIYVDLGTTLLKYGLMVLSLVIVLKLLYIDTTAFFGTLFVFGFSISFALQDTMKDFGAGIFIILFNYFGIGDTVKIGDVIGRIHEFRFFTTTIVKYNNILVEVPNSKIWNNEFINFSRKDEVNYELITNVSAKSDLEKLTTVASKFLKEHDINPRKIHPLITIENTKMGSLRLRCIVPITSNNYEHVHVSLPREIRIMLQKEGFKLNRE